MYSIAKKKSLTDWLVLRSLLVYFNNVPLLIIFNFCSHGSGAATVVVVVAVAGLISVVAVDVSIVFVIVFVVVAVIVVVVVVVVDVVAVIIVVAAAVPRNPRSVAALSSCDDVLTSRSAPQAIVHARRK